MDDWSEWDNPEEIAGFIQFSEWKDNILLRYDLCELLEELGVSEEDVIDRFDDYLIKMYREEANDE